MQLIRDDRKISIIGGLLLLGLTLASGMAVYNVMRQQIESTLGRGLMSLYKVKLAYLKVKFLKV
ncbi:MAG: hypothetical protein IPI97_00040 [Nitrosomonas sp.]|nr:hypothetical protein [Nitrosomonas sp.]